MSIKRYCDSCKNIIKTDYKKFKAKVKDVKQNSTDKCKWKKIDICMNCYNKIFIPTTYSVKLNNNIKDYTKKQLLVDKN